jgi:glycerol-3-phosphate O-acyltransferase
MDQEVTGKAQSFLTRDDYHVYPPVLEDVRDWPIYKVSELRDSFILKLNEYVFKRLTQEHEGKLYDLLAKTIFNERNRIKEEPWKVDPPNEMQTWNNLHKRLVTAHDNENSEEQLASYHKILHEIIDRYAEEIVGSFKVKTFKFARKFLTFFFNKLLNTGAAIRNFRRRIYRKGMSIHERLICRGSVEKVRSLMTKGTVVMVPTHFSNLDSILIGYAVDSVVGLPAFTYGAGLNLYNAGYAAYFMNRLGPYRVDRRKKNAIYLETLKGMSKLSIEWGVNNLFFPGGTRSRSGALESKLKMGLLGTTIEAQRSLMEQNKDTKIFIVPVILGYHIVLEAQFLIEQHLRQEGKEFYLRKNDQSYSFRKVARFVWRLATRKSDITLSFGKPMDVLGNFVDDDGESLDRHGNTIDIKDYFKADGKIEENLQREREYTKILANRIVERYHKDNIVLSSHIVAFAGFHLLKKEYPSLDLYALMRVPPEDFSFSTDRMHEILEQLKTRLLELESEGKIKLSAQIKWPNDELLKDGIDKMGSFHAMQPLMIDKDYQLIVSQNFKILYFYHNRLLGYGLEKSISK